MEIKQRKLLLGEGKEEVIIFKELLKFMQLDDIQVEAYSGKDKLQSYLKTLRLTVGFSQLVSLGITRDADDSKESALQSIRSALENSKILAPSGSNNQIATNLKIEVFILPDNQSNGMLEDLFLQVIKDAEISCIENYFECMRQATEKQPKNSSKAKIHAWLSSQAIPDKRLGEAVKAGYWDWINSAFNPLKEFILLL